MNQIPDAAVRYGSIALGLLIGLGAKYGVAINDGERVTWRTVLADALMLGMLGVIAIGTSDMLAISNVNLRVFVGAISALLSARLIKMVRDKAFNRAERATDDMLGPARATYQQIYSEAPLATPPEMQGDLDKLDDRP